MSKSKQVKRLSDVKGLPGESKQKLTMAQAFAAWMKGTGRSKLEDQTGLGRGALRKAFTKLSKKSWTQLNVESGRTKPKAKKAKVA